MQTSDSETSADAAEDCDGDIFAGMNVTDKDAKVADSALMPPPASPTRTAGMCVYLLYVISCAALVASFLSIC